MKRTKPILILIFMICLFVVVGCGGNNPTTKNDGITTTTNSNNQEGKDITVIFDYNYTGAPSPKSVSVEYDDVVEEPTKPERDLYQFTFWYKDQECKEKFNFEYSITSDITLYAGWKKVAVLVQFNTNGGSTVEDLTVTIGGIVSQPQNPTLENKMFVGWYKDSACTEVFDFTTKLSENIILYAKWDDVGEDTVKVTFNYNYDNAPNDGIFYEKTINKGETVGSVANPTRDAVNDVKYEFVRWYKDQEYSEEFDSNEAINRDITLYAKWYMTYTFEAEYVDLDGKKGVGYSGGASGKDLAVKDRYDAGASNGFFVTYLYYTDAFIEFKINSDKAASNVKLVLRLSVEYRDFVMDQNKFEISVNGTGIGYSPINLTGAFQDTEDEKRAFENYEISSSVSLKEGENIIRLTVLDDTEYDFGTMSALAPTIDCMYLSTDATLTWSPKESNILD